MSSIEQTLGNQSWVASHAQPLRELFPAEPVLVDLNLFLSVGFKLKVMGVDWRDENDLPKVFSFLQRLKLVDIKTFEGKTYAAQPLSPAEREQQLRTRAMQQSAQKINQTTPPADIKALASRYLDKFMKG